MKGGILKQVATFCPHWRQDIGSDQNMSTTSLDRHPIIPFIPITPLTPSEGVRERNSARISERKEEDREREREIGVAGMRERYRFRGTEYERKLSVFLLWHHHGVATIRIYTILYNNKIRRSRTYAQVLLTYYTGLNDLYNLCHIPKYNYFK